MLSDIEKKTIQTAYSQFLSAKSLKPRLGQKQMVAEIAKMLGAVSLDSDGVRQSDGHICVVEAGTGTGKTVAYLLSVLAVAKAMGKKVVVATATVALQEQIVYKDLPDLLRHSGLSFTFSLAKGRGRYLCLSKLDRLLTESDDGQFFPTFEDEQGLFSEEDVALYHKMMDGLSRGNWDGDRDAWVDEIEQKSWQRVTTDHRQCSGRQCAHVRQCAFFKARDAMDDVDCIVANHDLVLADLALGGGAILPAPEETVYVFDEGHHLPSKALNHFANNTRYKSTIRWLGQSEAQWPKLIDGFDESLYLVELSRPLESKLKDTRAIMESHLFVIQDVMAGVERNDDEPRLRFEQGVAPSELEMLAVKLSASFSELLRQLDKLHDEVSALMAEDTSIESSELEQVYSVIGSWLTRAQANLALWQSYSSTKLDESFPIARWITLLEFQEQKDFELVSSPILASKALERDLWQKCCAAVVTSATLTALNSFDRFKYQAGTYDDAVYLAVSSPFDYQNNAELHIPAAAVDGNRADEHTDAIIDLLPKILNLEEGSLILFSSRRQMNAVVEGLPDRLRDCLLVQGASSKHTLIQKHKAQIDDGQGSVLVGLASFAEGLDLPRDYCRHVVIAKIPFAVPDDPLEAALAEWIDAKGGNPFMQITVPDAAVKLVQACGRLLRTEEDTGRVTILDKRLLSKRYGSMILQSLPPFKRVNS